jgi:2-polyprenyl-6-methoxyphenol hydroxylase-like FAD-dependent oxidoreductase
VNEGDALGPAERVLKTAVIGAGPAGLLFTLIGKLLMGGRWAVQLYDKRESYARTHRLRMAPAPYLAIQRELNDARFDALITFLKQHDFAPEVNLLEAELSGLLASLGVRKVQRDVTTLDDLAVDTIVAADSVHSRVRALVARGVEPRTQTHQRVGRLRVTGRDLPAHLGVIDRFRLSKVLGSVVDYRLNHNGFAELDLFLSPAEFRLLGALGASPKAPRPLTSARIDAVNAPLLHAIVAHLESLDREIALHSTFELAHSIMPQRAFRHADKRVFLVGDAAVSLPFFRGMACLASCAHALARAHATQHFDGYERDVDAVVEREVAIVSARAQLIRVVRELTRISALLPFPLQSWWLSAAREPKPDRLAAGTGFNLLAALTAGALALAALVVPWLAPVALLAQSLGGVAYRWTLTLEPGPHRYLRRVWELQIFAIAAIGVALAASRRAALWSGLWWWLLGLAFALGIYGFEHVVARRLARGDFGDAPRP